MRKRLTISIDAELEAVSREKEVTGGLIQRLVDENATQKLDQHDYRKTWKKRGRGRKSSMTFLAVSLWGSVKRGSCRGIRVY